MLLTTTLAFHSFAIFWIEEDVVAFAFHTFFLASFLGLLFARFVLLTRTAGRVTLSFSFNKVSGVRIIVVKRIIGIVVVR